MDTLQSLLYGFSVSLTPTNLLYCALGVILGTIVGVLPGIGPLGGITLLLPTTFGMEPVSAIIMLAGIYYGAMYGGSTTSILVNIPGEAASTEARQKPDEFQYASAGVYSTTHFMWELILKSTGLRVRHMPTTGGGPIMMAVLGNHVEIGHCVVPAVCAPQVDARKIRLLAMMSEKRLPAYPDVPTLKVLGYDVTHSIWHALMVPAGTPPDVVAKLRQGLKGMAEDEAFKALMTKLGERIQYMSGEEFEQFWEQDYKKVGTLLRQLIKK